MISPGLQHTLYTSEQDMIMINWAQHRFVTRFMLQERSNILELVGGGQESADTAGLTPQGSPSKRKC